MKPLLQRAVLTEDDCAIWRAVCCSRAHMGSSWCARSAAEQSDRRDAALMYTLTGGGQVLGCHAARAWVSQRLPEAYV